MFTIIIIVRTYFSCPYELDYKGQSLIAGRGSTKREGGHVKFYPFEKGGGGGKSFSHAEGGAQQVLG